MNEPLVVICMSTYNGDRFLSTQLDSIINQQYSNWKLLIHDDGSNDNTLKIIKNYCAQDRRIVLSDNSQHLGVKKAFLSLTLEEDADFYMFSDQDDIWTSNKIEILLKEIEKYDTSIPLLIHGDYQTIDTKNQKINGFLSGYNNTDFNSLILKNNVTGCTCLFNRTLRNLVEEKINNIDYNKMIMHDWWLAILASAFGKVIHIDEKTVLYRQHEGNVIGAVEQKNKTNIQRLNYIFNLKDSNLRTICIQAAMILQLYKANLDIEQIEVLNFYNGLLQKWRPVKQIKLSKKYVPEILSVTSLIQFYLFVLSPKNVRYKFG